MDFLRRNFGSFLALMLVLVAGLACDGGSSSHGYIRDATGRPLAGAKVRIVDEKGNILVPNTESDEAGRYSAFKIHAPRKFDRTLIIEKSGYITMKAPIQDHDPLGRIWVLVPETASGREAIVQKIVKPNGFTLYLPSDSWESHFFETIKPVAAAANLLDLREEPIPNFGVEVRVWVGFNGKPLQGFVLRETNHVVTAWRLQAGSRSGVTKTELISTHADLYAFWKQVTAKGLLSLSGSTQLQSGPTAPESESYVFETNLGNAYRTYFYPNAAKEDSPEARQAVGLVNILRTELKPI
jgi:hypothetical protein